MITTTVSGFLALCFSWNSIKLDIYVSCSILRILLKGINVVAETGISYLLIHTAGQYVVMSFKSIRGPILATVDIPQLWYLKHLRHGEE